MVKIVLILCRTEVEEDRKMCCWLLVVVMVVAGLVCNFRGLFNEAR